MAVGAEVPRRGALRGLGHDIRVQRMLIWSGTWKEHHGHGVYGSLRRRDTVVGSQSVGFYVPPQEDIIDDVGLGARYSERSPIVEGNMSVGSVLASDGCDVPLQGSITEPFFQQDKHDHTVIVGPKSCKRKSPILSYCADGDGADGGGSSNQSSKVSIREGPSTHATVTPGFDRISDVLPTDASESEHLPECITAQDTTISQPDSRKAHLSALQQERGEKVTQDLEDISANIGSVEKDHIHGDLTLPSTSVLLSISCNGANQGSKYETNLQPGTATEKVLFQNSDPASINKHSVLQNNNKTPVKDPEKKQQAVNEEARKEGGNDNSSHET
ncbi:TRF-like 10 [Zea mays]|uniref:TRF-like 10 n=1 Tax=Zea mays TaxID=4577 RepID=A0A1D6N7Y3_MAIZE|nr:TRF-like 10 [Zea mays]